MVPTKLLDRVPTPIRVVLVFAALYIFLLGIGGMSASFKWMGADYTQQLIGSDSPPIVALFIGILATTLVQSSSTTTSMAVALVATGQLPYHSAVYIVMGANVGTTVTNTLVSLGHMRHTAEYKRAFAAATVHDFFNLIVLLILFPLEYFTGVLDVMAQASSDAFHGVGGAKLANPIKAITQPVLNGFTSFMSDLGDGGGFMLTISILVTFAGLLLMVKMLKSIMMAKLESLFDRILFRSPLMALFFGLILTILVQSSSISTSVVVPLVGAGVLTIAQVLPYTMGANIGTTMTALIASLAAIAGTDHGDAAAMNTATLGLVLAFHHVLFNVVGVALMWWFRWIPIKIAETFAAIAMRNRLIPLVYIISVFYLIPFLVVIVGR
ncbi:MAG: Na/Pi symporter [Planctomycetota bacterium]|nr:Na/Pi symporter [Planctomycetota bacterium]